MLLVQWPKKKKKTGELGYKTMSGDHPNYNIIENDQNTEKRPGELRRLAVTQTSMEDHQLTLMWKTHGLNINNNDNNNKQV